jgi:hypothetical protein
VEYWGETVDIEELDLKQTFFFGGCCLLVQHLFVSVCLYAACTVQKLTVFVICTRHVEDSSDLLQGGLKRDVCLPWDDLLFLHNSVL